jgi:uncharacterized membrane protein
MTTQNPTTIKKTVLIDAPVEEVFAYYANPSNSPEIWPSLVEVKDIMLDEKGHPQTFKWTYKMAGMRFEGSSEYLEYVPNERLVYRSKGGIQATSTINFAELDGKTQISEEMEYSIPIPLLGKVAERFLIKMNENEMTTVHNNLKARLESTANFENQKTQ